MASGNILIRVGGALIDSEGIVIVVIALGFALLWMVVTVSNHFREKRDEKVLQAARDFDIGDGVTLLQGVQAYFGDEGDWWVTTFTVYLFAGVLRGWPRAVLLIDVETWTLTVSIFEPCADSTAGGEADDLIQAMVHAVRG